MPYSCANRREAWRRVKGVETDAEEKTVEGRGRDGRLEVDMGAEGLGMILFDHVSWKVGKTSEE